MAEQNQQLDALFEKLNTLVKAAQHKKIVRTAAEILAIDPNDEDAIKCQATALMQLSEFDAALSLINKSHIASKLAFEKAYCLYRIGRIEEGLEAVAAVSDDQAVAKLQLQAQLYYRLGKNKDCIQIYDNLFQQHKADSLELKTNVVAAYVAASLAAEIPDLMSAMKINAKQSFEVAFNKACGLVALQEFAAAENELRLALKLGRETLFEEECSEREVEEELAPLTVQLAYVLGRLGRTAEAQELYDKVLDSLQADEPTMAVANNNAIADSGKADGSTSNRKYLSNAVKKLEALADKDKVLSLRLLPSLEARLSSAQKQMLHLNRALLYFMCGRTDACRELSGLMTKAYGDTPFLSLLRATLLVADNKVQEADSLLESYAAAHPGSALQPTLMRAQLLLEGGNSQRALELLGTIKDSQLQGSPAMLATRVQLHQQLNDAAGADALLEQALSFWQQQQPRLRPEASAATTWCLQSLVSLKLKLGKLADAKRYYEQLQATGEGQSSAVTGVLARLARALALSDVDSVPRLCSGLPGLQGELRGLDVSALTDLASVTGAAKRKDLVAEAELKRAADDMDIDQQPKQKKSKKRKRKPRLPKGFNPELPNGGLPLPDPERWLPKWERSDHKKKKMRSRDKAAAAVKGSQGAGKVDESLDRTKALEPAKVEAKATKPALPARAGKGKGKK